MAADYDKFAPMKESKPGVKIRIVAESSRLDTVILKDKNKLKAKLNFSLIGKIKRKAKNYKK